MDNFLESNCILSKKEINFYEDLNKGNVRIVRSDEEKKHRFLFGNMATKSERKFKVALGFLRLLTIDCNNQQTKIWSIDLIAGSLAFYYAFIY